MNLIIYPFASVSKNFGLLMQLTRRAVELRHKGSWLGRLWIVAHPLLLLAIYTVVFSVIYNGSYGVIESETPAQYALGIFLGLTFLHLFTDSLSGAVTGITGNPNYVKKVVFPLETIPVSIVLSSLYNFMVSLMLCLLGILLLTDGIALSILWLPVVAAPMVLLSTGIACAAAALGVFYRDIAALIQVISLSLLWMSGIFYSARSIPEGFWQYVKYNPVLLTVEMARDSALWNLPPNLQWLAYTYGVSIVVFYLGFWLFRSLRGTFADIV